MKSILFFIIVVFTSSPIFSQIKNAKEKVYSSIDSIKAANPDSVYNVALGYCDKITKIPKCIFKLKNLESLSILCYEDIENPRFTNYLKHIPRKIVRLTNLKILKISRCGLTEIPAYINKLTKLEELRFVKCNIKMIPETIGDLIYLKIFVISVNRSIKIKTLPVSINKLKNIYLFDVASGGCFKKDSIVAYKKRLPKNCTSEFGIPID